VVVADTGIGMTAEEQSCLFQEFVRIRNDKTRDIRGTGLGLAIVRQIAGLYQGTVSVRSEPGKGSTFSLTLPVS
jgi:two-component system phosphate regulon sensor histidine kinase PhoR